MESEEEPAPARRRRGPGELREDFLMVVAERGPVRQAEVRRVLEVSTPTMAGLVSRCADLLIVGEPIERSPVLSIRPGVRLPDGRVMEGVEDAVGEEHERDAERGEGGAGGERGGEVRGGSAPEPVVAAGGAEGTPASGGGGLEHVEAEAERDEEAGEATTLNQLWFEHVRNMIARAKNEPDCPAHVFEHIERALMTGPPRR